MNLTSCVLTLGALTVSTIAIGQAQTSPQFEVASVRPNRSGSRYVTLPSEYPGGRFQAINVEFRCVVYYAFALEGPKRLSEGRPACTGLEEQRLQSLNIVEGLPAWADERFDIVGKVQGVRHCLRASRPRSSKNSASSFSVCRSRSTCW